MDYKYKSVNDAVPQQQQPPPVRYTQHQSSTLTYFTQQALRASAGYMAPHFGNTVDHIQHQPTNMHEAIRREIEKERIREEIIAEEIAQRRMLEFEVRREIMMERQLSKQRGEGFSPFASPGMSFSATLPLLKQQSDARSMEERIARSLDERRGRGISISGLSAGNEIGRLDIVPFEDRISEIPFQQRSVVPKVSEWKHVSHSVEPMISELQPSLEPRNGKDRIIFLSKPNTSLSGAKRKAVTPPVELVSKPPSCSILKKNGKEDWSCAICQVSATSERGLNDHLRGKKHKSKEAALRAQRNGKNYSIGLFPKKPKTINLVEVNDNLNQEQMVKAKVELSPNSKLREGSSLKILEKGGKDDGMPSSRKNANAAQKSQKAKDHKKKKFKFWCATCKVGALSEKSMEAHRIGKKHVARLRDLNGSSIATSTTKVESTQTDHEALEDVKNVATEETDDVGKAVVTTNPEEQEEVSSGF